MQAFHINRRQVLKAGAVAGLPFLVATSAKANGDAPRRAHLTVGLATLGFHDYSNAPLAEELAATDIKTVQLFLNQRDSRYWKYNGRSDISDLTAERCKVIGNAYRSAGVSIHSLGVYTNLIHPDERERNANLAYFEAMMKVAQWMDVHTLITEAGHYHEANRKSSVEYHFREDVWRQMVCTGKRLAEMAKRHRVTVLVEPFYRGFLASAKRTRLFLEEVGSSHIRALLDPANLLEVNDLEEMFTQLAPWVDCLHAKDRKLHVDQGVAAGKGDLDYLRFATLAAKHTPQAPLILEYVGPKDYKQALQHLNDAIASL